jgi:2-haloacid dehalogenase
MPDLDIKALLFDVFGTCVDLRAGLKRAIEAVARSHDVTIDAYAFAGAWRDEYQPAVEQVRAGKRPFVALEHLNRESLDTVLPRFGLDALSEDERRELNFAWRRLDPWPGAVAGLTRLKRRFIIAPHSNGNLAMLVGMAKFGGLPWDCILGAEIAQSYKPNPASYRGAVAMLGLAPGEVMMVAGHNGDLRAAQAQGLRTGFIVRPLERRPNASPEFEPTGAWDVVAKDFHELADRLGA